ncbi:MAG: hypothetical protein DMF34_11370, partial [Verrucomicrobia bacterium]
QLKATRVAETLKKFQLVTAHRGENLVDCQFGRAYKSTMRLQHSSADARRRRTRIFLGVFSPKREFASA